MHTFGYVIYKNVIELNFKNVLLYLVFTDPITYRLYCNNYEEKIVILQFVGIIVQILAIEFVLLANKFILWANKFILLATELVALAIEFITWA